MSNRKIKGRYLLMSVVVASILAGSACTAEGDLSASSGSGVSDSAAPETVTKQLISDSEFSEGINVTGLKSQAVENTSWLYQNTVNTTYGPYWTLGQYCDLSSTRQNYDSSKNDLSLGTLFDEPKGIEGKKGEYFTLVNQSGSKYIAVSPSSGEAEINIDTSKEYIDQTDGSLRPRVDGEDWVHMILQQSTGAVYLSELDSLSIELEFSFTSLEAIESSVGASQFQWIFSIHDSESVIGDYMWFNLTVYDNRYRVFPGTQMFDGGKDDATGNFIYAPSGTEVFGEDFDGFTVGERYAIRLDLKAYMKQAFETAQEKGALAAAKWENMAINGFNLGWEVSNVAKVGVHIYELSLAAETKSEE